MPSALKYLWKQILEHIGLFAILLVMMVLRLPNFLEPYWYGDEAIYLSVGHALNTGSLLYTDIVDHKTPLIYYLARVPDQFSFRLLLSACMVITLALFYCFLRQLFKKNWLALVATTFLMLGTTLPWFEGNIPNGELFVMFFVMMGAFILKHTQVFRHAATFDPDHDQLDPNRRQNLIASLRQMGSGLASEFWLLLVAGAFFGLAILTKVPALLDLGAFMAAFWFVLSNSALNHARSAQLITIFKLLFVRLVVFVAGVSLPIIASIIYFAAIGSGADYLQYGLLYNLHYSGTWKLQFASELLTWLYSFPAKLTLLVAGFGLMTILGRKVPFRLQFAFTWFVLALFATLLSNRPYPHYFIQIMPALSILLALLVEVVARFIALAKVRAQMAISQVHSALLITIFICIAYWVTGSVLVTLKVGLYPTVSYYVNSWLYAGGQIDQRAYFGRFDSLVNENYEVAEVIRQLQLEKIFIWGTNPMLYAQSKTVPTSRFTVAFHIKDVNDFEPTLQKIKMEKPKMIIVMNGEEKTFPELNQYLARNYLVNYQYRHMTLYLRRFESTAQLLKRN